MRSTMTMLAALLSAAPLCAQQATPAPAPATPVTPAPAADATPIDPARLAAATSVVAKVFPVGTYKRLMGASMQQMMGTMTDLVGAMPLREVAALGGLEPDKAAELGEGTVAEVMAIYDPAYRERMRIGTTGVTDALSEVMTGFEPSVRTGLARAYARKFSAVQLAELDRFFLTPTGSFYAAESMGLYMDPELMKEMMAFVPEMFEQMPKLMAGVQAKTDALPKPRKIAELTPAERTRLAALLGVMESALRDPPLPTVAPPAEDADAEAPAT